jgi:Holliday junction resolvase RusA-like endonuclease
MRKSVSFAGQQKTLSLITFSEVRGKENLQTKMGVGCGFAVIITQCPMRQSTTTHHSDGLWRNMLSTYGRNTMGQEKISATGTEKAFYKKCGQCRWLNGEKSSVGIACTHPEKVWRSRTSKYHYSHTKACKMFTPYESKMTCEIPLKLPSLNEYIYACRANRFLGSKMKKGIEKEIEFFISDLPRFVSPVKIHFHWVEENHRRDLDNICFAKKFILDALVKFGKLKDDNRKCVTAFTDTFSYDTQAKVILEIEEVNDNG